MQPHLRADAVFPRRRLSAIGLCFPHTLRRDADVEVRGASWEDTHDIFEWKRTTNSYVQNSHLA